MYEVCVYCVVGGLNLLLFFRAMGQLGWAEEGFMVNF